MKVIPFQSAPTLLTLPTDKVQRMSCCCRINELLPLVRQLHDEARARRQAAQAGQAEAA